MKIGLLPGSFKPYHRGHDDLVRLAASENDLLLVFNSDASREEIDGRTMVRIIDKYVKPTLPKNVRIISVGMPVAAVFQEIEDAEENNSKDFFTIYSDTEDIRKYSTAALQKYAPNLLEKGQVVTRGVPRGVETTDVSGQEMRQYLKTGNIKKFTELLPLAVQRHSAEIIGMLRGDMREELLKNYIKELLEEIAWK